MTYQQLLLICYSEIGLMTLWETNCFNIKMQFSFSSATSQPEAVHYLHHKSPSRILPPVTQSVEEEIVIHQESRVPPEPDENVPPESVEYDPNASKTNTTISGHIALNGKVVPIPPQHLALSHQSAQQMDGTVTDADDTGSFSAVWFTGQWK